MWNLDPFSRALILAVDPRAQAVLAPVDWVVIAFYALGMLAVGWYYSRRTASTEDYLLGGRTMKSFGVGLSMFATLLSTVSYLSSPGEVILHGPMILCGLLAFPLVVLIVGWFMIPYIMRLRVTSAYEILETRFGLSVRLLGAGLFLALRLLWMATIIHITTSHVLIPLLGWDPRYAPLVCAVLGAITIIYTAMGGLRAVVLTDVIQTCILFAGALLTLMLITRQLGGVANWWPDRWHAHWQQPVWHIDTTARISFPLVFISTLTWHVCTAGSDQVAIQRYLATRDARAARRVLTTSLAANAAVHILLALLGLALLAYYTARSAAAQETLDFTAIPADSLFPRFIVAGLPAGISGLIVAALLAAAMSSLSSGVNSASAVITIDFIDRFRRTPLDEQAHIRAARWASVFIGAVVVLLTVFVGSVPGNLLEVAYRVANLLVAPMFVMFFLAMFVKFATSQGAWSGVLTAVFVAVLIAYWKPITGREGISFLFIMPASLAAGVLTGTLVSALRYLMPRPR